MEEGRSHQLVIPREIRFTAPDTAVRITWMKQTVIPFQGYIGEYCKKSSANRYAAYMQPSSATRPRRSQTPKFLFSSQNNSKPLPLSLLPAVTRVPCPILISPSLSPTQLGMMMSPCLPQQNWDVGSSLLLPMNAVFIYLSMVINTKPLASNTPILIQVP